MSVSLRHEKVVPPMHSCQGQIFMKKVVHSVVLYFIAYELSCLSDVNFVELLSKRPYIMFRVNQDLAMQQKK